MTRVLPQAEGDSRHRKYVLSALERDAQRQGPWGWVASSWLLVVATAVALCGSVFPFPLLPHEAQAKAAGQLQVPRVDDTFAVWPVRK